MRLCFLSQSHRALSFQMESLSAISIFILFQKMADDSLCIRSFCVVASVYVNVRTVW